MVDLEIAEVRPDDLSMLVMAGGQAGYFADRLARQEDRRGVLLVAWHSGRPVGTAYLWLEPAEEPEIQQYLPDTPLITHVEVFEPTDRNHRTGTRLIHDAEERLRDLKHTKVALAVEVTNEDAARFYRRLGYRDWGHQPVNCVRREWLPDGTVEESNEKCLVLVKTLTVAPSR